MNERIKQLYEQSFLTDDYVNVGINGVELGIKFDPEKFAELIIREYSYDVMDLTAAPEHVAMAARHWGVEL